MVEMFKYHTTYCPYPGSTAAIEIVVFDWQKRTQKKYFKETRK